MGPSSYLGPRLAVRDGRGSYIMSTGMLISVPFTDTLTRNDDILTDIREDTMMAAKCFTSSGLACCCGSPIARQYNLLPAKTATNFQT